MKLWFQVLFVEGYLWRDRRPADFEETRMLSEKVTRSSFVILMLPLLGLYDSFIGNWETGLPVIAAGTGWFFWSAYSIRLDRHIGNTELWISVNCAAGLVMAIGTVSLGVVAVLINEWGLLWIPPVLWLCAVTTWLYHVESSYFLFGNPSTPRGIPELDSKKGLPWWIHILSETYWRLPRRIALGIRPPTSADGGTTS